MHRRLIGIAIGIVFVAAAIGVLWLLVLREERAKSAEIERGRILYAAHCAACHGTELEGQPNWNIPRLDGGMPAPPLNGAGHAMHHSKMELFRTVKRGKTAATGKGGGMPAFENVLSDDEIAAILGFIESTWITR
jgi:mono/diheme cytochrome c family protein